MKISKSQLRKILREAFDQKGYDDFTKKFKQQYQQDDGSYRGHPDDPREELASQIRNASKDVHGRKDVYDLEDKTIEELEDILFDLAHSQEQQAMDDIDRDEMEDGMGRDGDLSPAERAPRRQGMSRRPGGSKSQRRMEGINKIVRQALNEKGMISNKKAKEAFRKGVGIQGVKDIPVQYNAPVLKMIDRIIATAHQKDIGSLKRIGSQIQRFSKKAMEKEKSQANPDDVLDNVIKGSASGSGEKEGAKDSGKDNKVVKFD